MQEHVARIRLYVIEEQELMRTAFCSLISHDQQLETVGSSSSIDEAVWDVERLQPHVVIIRAEGRGERIIEPICRLKNASPNVALMVVLEVVTPEVLSELIRCDVSSVCSSNIKVASLLVGIRATASGCTWFGPRTSSCLRAVVATAGSTPPSRPDRAKFIESTLTGREGEILAAMSRGLTNQQIADQLMLSIETVKTYVRRIMDKSAIRTRRELATCFADPQATIKLPAPESCPG